MNTYILFTINEQYFTTSVLNLKSILPYQECNTALTSKNYIEGIMKHQVQMIAVLDGQKYFNISDEESVKKHILVIEFPNDEIFGLIVNDVCEIIEVEDSQIKDIRCTFNENSINKILHIDDKENCGLYNIITQKQFENHLEF